MGNNKSVNIQLIISVSVLLVVVTMLLHDIHKMCCCQVAAQVGRTRALCRIKLLPVTHVLVDTWMLTVKPVNKLSDVPDDLKWTTNTHDTIYTHFQGITNNIYGFGRPFAPSFFSLSTHISTRPYSILPVQMTDLCIKLWEGQNKPRGRMPRER